MSTDKIPNGQPVPTTETQPAAPRPVQRFIGGFGPSPEQARAWQEAAIKRRLERETASSATANNSGEANNSPATGGLESGPSDDRAGRA